MRGVETVIIVLLCFVTFGPAHAAGLAAGYNSLPGISSPDPAEQFQVTSLPAGTPIFIRLDTAVSTQSSHLHTPVMARVVREVGGAGGVAIPLGALVRGDIKKLIPSSNPAERARLLLFFNRLEIQGQAPISLDGHVKEVENSRETVLPDGTIQGVLKSELPIARIDKVIDQLGGVGDEARKTEDKYFGKANTLIEIPQGADLVLVLDKPLALNKSFSSATSGQIPQDIHATINRLLAEAPHRTSGINGNPGDPVNLLFIGNEDEIVQAFEQAGWSVPEKSTQNSIWQTIRAAMGDNGYGKAPVSDLVLFGRTEDLAFEKMFDTFAKRHHLRLWRSPLTTPDGREIWLAASTHDNGLDIRPSDGVASHTIDPNIDLERDKVGADLLVTGKVAAEQLITRGAPLSKGLTATGAPWKTDGYLRAIVLK